MPRTYRLRALTASRRVLGQEAIEVIVEPDRVLVLRGGNIDPDTLSHGAASLDLPVPMLLVPEGTEVLEMEEESDGSLGLLSDFIRQLAVHHPHLVPDEVLKAVCES